MQFLKKLDGKLMTYIKLNPDFSNNNRKVFGNYNVVDVNHLTDLTVYEKDGYYFIAMHIAYILNSTNDLKCIYT